MSDPLQVTPQEESLLATLRVREWSNFHGQPNVKESLRISIQAAKERAEALDHVLLYGPPGLGKTTLSHLIAQEMHSQLRITSGTALAKTGDLAAILTSLEPQDVLFIDEIHRLSKPIEEMLYSVMEDFALDIIIGKGPSARTVRLDIPKFTLVGATTRFGALASPFRDRFGVIHRMYHYQPAELLHILQHAALILKVDLDQDSAMAIARRSRGTPRIALKLLKRVRDFAQVKMNQSHISVSLVEQALDLQAVDHLGLTDTDHRYLKIIVEKFSGGPVGLSTLSAALSEDPITLEEVVEPFLLQIGFLEKTPKGRMATPLSTAHLQ